MTTLRYAMKRLKLILPYCIIAFVLGGIVNFAAFGVSRYIANDWSFEYHTPTQEIKCQSSEPTK